MGADEIGTLKGLTERVAILDKLAAEHRGRIVNTAGDSVLAEFGSTVEAVQCAFEVQTVLVETNANIPADKRIHFRMGIHIGDVIVRGRELFGDVVNIAARLQSIAKPGGVCISSAAHDQIRKILPIVMTDLGAQTVRNIEEPITAYEAAALGEPCLDETTRPRPIPANPSIAVLPFENMSGCREQDYFADGMVEEIITALSRFRWLFVVARNSSFTFKGRAIDIKEVGRRLGVRYVLEGSVRKASGKIRVTGQLIDAETGIHIWADRFERNLQDVFALQDEVTLSVVSAIQRRLLQMEIGIATQRGLENLTARDFFLRAVHQLYLSSREGMAEATKLAHRALELDPGFGRAAALAAYCHSANVLWDYATDPQSERNEALRLVRLALSVDDGDPDTLAWAGFILAYMVGDCERAIEIAERAVELNPNSFSAWNSRGWVYRVAGQPEEALPSFERAICMSPVDPSLHSTLAGKAYVLIELARFEEAIVAAKKARRRAPLFPPAYRCLASAFAHLGHDAEAHEAAARLLELDPNFTISTWIARGGQFHAKLMIEGLRKAGLPVGATSTVIVESKGTYCDGFMLPGVF